MTLKGWFGVSTEQPPLLMEWRDLVASVFSEVSSMVKDMTGVWRAGNSWMLLHLRQPFAPGRQVEGCRSPSLRWMSWAAESLGPCSLHLHPPPSPLHASPSPAQWVTGPPSASQVSFWGTT